MLGDFFQELLFEVTAETIGSVTEKMSWCGKVSFLAAIGVVVGFLILVIDIARPDLTPISHWWIIGSLIFGGSATSVVFLGLAERVKVRGNRNKRRRRKWRR
jgi:hypothetical protein